MGRAFAVLRERDRRMSVRGPMAIAAKYLGGV